MSGARATGAFAAVITVQAGNRGGTAWMGLSMDILNNLCRGTSLRRQRRAGAGPQRWAE